jgi:hypothetical protein
MLKPFHVVKRPLKTEQNKEDRLWFANFLSEWGDEDFLHLACSDEFFIYTIRKPNSQNDRIWAKTLADIDEDERFQNMVKYPECLGIFILFTARNMMWVIKEKGEKWNGDYFRETVIPEVHTFLTDRANVIHPDDVVLLHDKAPGWAAAKTQELLTNGPIDFFTAIEYPGASPDLNATEHIGSIVCSRVEALMSQEEGQNRYSREKLMINVECVLQQVKVDTELFENLLLSYPRRLQAVNDSNGGHTDY